MGHYFTNDYNLKKNEKIKKVQINDTEFIFYTDNGVFNKKGLDYGTRLLLENIELGDKKEFLDVGCGCGPIGLFISKQDKNYTVDMVDVNDTAIELVKKAKAINNINNINVFKSNVYEKINKTYDMIITNPPIHAGKKVVYDIISNAKNYLNITGELWIVIRKDQGAKSLIKDFSSIYNFKIVTKDKGFYVLKASIIYN